MNDNNIPNQEIKEDAINEIKEESKNNQSEGESIEKFINKDVAKQLMEMGFSKNASEKSCFFTQSNLEKAIEWIYEHQNDADFEEELRVVGQKETKPLTEEEVKQKAKELQELARKRFIQKQKESEEEQERNRVRISNFFNYFRKGIG